MGCGPCREKKNAFWVGKLRGILLLIRKNA